MKRSRKKRKRKERALKRMKRQGKWHHGIKPRPKSVARALRQKQKEMKKIEEKDGTV